jgi:Ca2+-binding EF-hand superfamily protein
MDDLRITAGRLARMLALSSVLLSAGPVGAAPPGDPADVDRDVHNLVLLAPAHPVFLQLRVQVDGRGLRSVRTAYAAQLVKQYDKSGDGALSRDEAQAIPPLVKSPTATDTVAIAERWEAIDKDPADDQVSVEELAAYIDRLFGNPFLLSVKPERATQTVDMFVLLDLNHDGRLSREEFAAARRILGHLDFDDDETLSIEELQPARAPQNGPVPAVPASQSTEQPFLLLDDPESIGAATRQILQRYSPPGVESGAMHLSREALRIDEAAFTARDADRDGALDATELAAFLGSPTPHLVVEAQLLQTKPGRPKLMVASDSLGAVHADGTRTTEKLALAVAGINLELRLQGNRGAVSDNRNFYRTKFNTADQDKNKYLSEQEFGAVGLPNADFKAVDRNGDGMIVVEELMAYVDQESASSQARVEFSISNDGKSVFEVMDANLDRRLSPRELAHAFDRLRPFDLNGDDAITAVELAGRFRALLELGKPVLFRRQGNMAGANTTVPVVNQPSAGPDWFRRMDRNRDGDVYLREFLGPLTVFKKLDADGDGLISAEEAGRSDTAGSSGN